MITLNIVKLEGLVRVFLNNSWKKQCYYFIKRTVYDLVTWALFTAHFLHSDSVLLFHTKAIVAEILRHVSLRWQGNGRDSIFFRLWSKKFVQSDYSLWPGHTNSKTYDRIWNEHSFLWRQRSAVKSSIPLALLAYRLFLLI